MRNKVFKNIVSHFLLCTLVISSIGLDKVTVKAEGSDAVEYVKEQYLYALTHTEKSVGSYTIQVASQGYSLEYDTSEGSEWKQINEFFSKDAYSDFEIDNTKNFVKPSRYYVSGISPVIKDRATNLISEIYVKFDTSVNLDSEVISENITGIEARYNAIMRDVRSAAGLSDAEKVLLVHDSMARELDADYENRLQDDGEGTSHWGTLKNGTGSSQGYAYLFKACMNELGIKCDVVYNEAIPNFWNMVEVDGCWYHVDVWMDDLVTSDGPLDRSYSNVIENTTMHNDRDEDTSNDGYVSHKFYLRTGDKMRKLGYLAWGKVKAIGNISSLAVAKEASTTAPTGIYMDSIGNMAFLNGSWYIASSDELNSRITQSDYSGSNQSVIITDYPVMYVQSDGQYIYYSSGEKIIRMDAAGNDKRTGFEAEAGWKITEFAVKQGKLCITVSDGTGFEKHQIDASNNGWILEGCQHNWVDKPTAPTCTKKGYTTKVCSICDYSYVDETSYTDPTGHSGGTASCINKAKCTVCGMEYGELDPNNHVGSDVIKDSKPSTCNAKGYSGDKYCSACNKVSEKGAELPLDPSNHSGNKEKRNEKAATCSEEGYSGDEYCKDCGVLLSLGTTIPVQSHDYKAKAVAPTCTEQGYTEYKCSRCNDSYIDSGSYVPAAGHKGGAATCISKAVCSVCKEEYGELSASNHIRTELKNFVEATCGAAGYSGDIYCKDCNVLIEAGHDIPALGHSYVAQIVAPTCIEDGYTTQTCSTCKDTYIDPAGSIPATGHTGGKATCVSSAKCEKCGEEYGAPDPNGHKYIAKVIEGSCLQEGHTEYTCEFCRDSYSSDVTGKTDHRGGKAGCCSKAKCEVCGVEYGEIDPSSHINTEVKDAVEATCTTEGYSGNTFCKDCGVKVSDGATVPKKEHSFSTAVTPPTCTQKGYTTYTCKICNFKKEDNYKAALGHNYVTTTTPATGKEPGKVVTKCSRCGDIKSTTTVDYAKDVTLAVTSYTYNGSKKKPAVSVTDSKGKLISSSYYSVTYSNNLNVGQAKVLVTMKGKYSGTFTRYFMIKPKPTLIKSMSGLTRGIRINWKKQTTQITGYEIYYSTSSSFSSNSTKKVTLTKGFDTKKITGLTKNKKYYAKIRTYANVKINGVTTKLYSSWSTVKNAKAK